jgi:hypothetical protein
VGRHGPIGILFNEEIKKSSFVVVDWSVGPDDGLAIGRIGLCTSDPTNTQKESVKSITK